MKIKNIKLLNLSSSCINVKCVNIFLQNRKKKFKSFKFFKFIKKGILPSTVEKLQVNAYNLKSKLFKYFIL